MKNCASKLGHGQSGKRLSDDKNPKMKEETMDPKRLRKGEGRY
jgi:hypothetical protein